MRIVVTGGAGFIGSHLVEALLKEGNDVVVVDNFVTGQRKNLNFSSDLTRGLTVLEHDALEPISIEGAVDRVYHLACPASPEDYRTLPLETLRVCAEGTQRALDLAGEKRARFLFTSTSEVYGDPLVHPQPESYFGNVNCIGPRSCYDEGKRFAESLVVHTQQERGVEAVIVRVFNTYGPRMRRQDGRVIPNFIEQALNGQPITLYGTGGQTRSFCYVDDMVKGLMALMESGQGMGPFNWGNPEEVTIQALAERVIVLTGSQSSLIHKPLPQNDPTRRCPDITKASAVLGFVPTVDLEEGLRRTVAYFKLDESATDPV